MTIADPDKMSFSTQMTTMPANPAEMEMKMEATRILISPMVSSKKLILVMQRHLMMQRQPGYEITLCKLVCERLTKENRETEKDREIESY
jgi:hypothetical protein